MALNVRADYIAAEEQYRAAQTAEEKLAALRRMLATAPKHKAAEKLLKDLKQKISKLRGEVVEQQHKSKGAADPYVIRPQGAGQVLVLGAPNVGKSAILAARTQAPVKVADYSFTTQVPVPGIAFHEDVSIQLVDTPPITAEHVAPGLLGALQHADALLLVVNPSALSALDDLEVCLSLLKSRNLQPVFEAEPTAEEDGESMPVRTLVACTHADEAGAAEALAALQELYPTGLRFVSVSPTAGTNMDELMKLLFELLHVVRVYTKPRGKAADMEKPFVLARGSTVHDLAEHIHHELAAKLHGARVWGGAVHDGQQVTSDYELHDKEVVELHA